jgi:hypothetical protein
MTEMAIESIFGVNAGIVVTGGLKVLNFGGIKMPTSTAFGFKPHLPMI